jgi:ABC-type nitrate/sulfonate/bicarbonate transport system substrate-binding protein
MGRGAANLTPETNVSRRHFLAASTRTLVGLATTQSALAAPAPQVVRMTTPTPGSAGTIWRPLIEQRGAGGLNVEWVSGAPGQGQVLLAAGTVDVAFYGVIGIAQVIAHGADLVIFGPALNNHGRWIVRGDAPYHSPHDLIGKRIATQAENSETFLQARMAAATIGIDLKRDCELFFGPPTANVALFERGDVDALIALEPIATRLIGGGARQIAQVGDMWRQGTGDGTPLFLVGLAARRDWFDANRATAKTLVTMIGDIHRDLKDEPDRFSALHDALGIPASETAAIALLPKRLPEIYSTDWGEPVFADIDRQIEFAVKTSLLKGPPERPVYATA